MRLLKISIALFFGVFLNLFAQDVPTLRATSYGRLINLNWFPPVPAPAYFSLYRGTNPITLDTVSMAEEIGQVRGRAFSYVDVVPQEDSSYYYALLSSPMDEWGNPMKFTAYITPNPVYSTQVAHVAENLSFIRELNILENQEGLEIRFASVGDPGNLILLRSEVPITTIEIARRSTLITTFPSSWGSVIDNPPTGVDVYYSIHDVELFSANKSPIIPYQNTSVIPVRNSLSFDIPAPLQDTYTTESEPSLPNDALDEVPILNVDAIPIDLQSQVTDYAEERQPRLFVFEGDITDSVTTDEIRLQDILINSFLRSNYRESEGVLRQFLAEAQQENKKMVPRIYFYLAQSLIGQERYAEAFMYFIAIRSQGNIYVETETFVHQLITYFPDHLGLTPP